MQIQVWLDISCPFCYIAGRNLQLALEKLIYSNEIEIIYRSFELDPNAPVYTDEDIYTQLANKYKMSLSEAKSMTTGIARQAKAVRLKFNFDSLIPTNTFDAHRLLHFANGQGLVREMSERLFKAFFTDSLNVADHKVLGLLATEVGLDQRETEFMLASKKYTNAVHNDQQKARDLDITSVPFFIFNDKHMISGAQSTESLSDILLKVQAEEQSVITTISSDSGFLGGSCSV